MQNKKRKIWVLVPIIIKNLLLIFFAWLKSIARKLGWKTIAAILAVVFVIGGFFIWRTIHQRNQIPQLDRLTLSEAAKMGDKANYQMLIQIQNSNCEQVVANSCLQRGDVVLIASADKEWSPAEEEGFLIIKIELTPKQAELMTQPLEKISDKAKGDPKQGPMFDQIQRRKFAVDLVKMGIASDDQKGRIISDKVFTADILKEK